MLSTRKRRISGICVCWALLCGMLSSCGLIFDPEGDCSVHYRVKFRYDMNLSHADAFAHEVRRVTLNVLDADGKVVWSGSESGEALAGKDWTMGVDVPPGRYGLLAWCGSGDGGSWKPGVSKSRDGLGCALNSSGTDGSGTAFVDGRLDALYHGYASDVDFTADEGTVVAEVGLTKDTKSVKLVVQQIADMPIDGNDFDIFITCDNGRMDWDNSLVPAGTVEYRAWSVENGTVSLAGVSVASESSVRTSESFVRASENFGQTSVTGSPATRASGERGIVVAELGTGRMVLGNSPRLHLRKKSDGAEIFSVPLIDYALLVRGASARDIPEQEFLDRQDEMELVLFLNGDDRWESLQINILSWKVVVQNTSL